MRCKVSSQLFFLLFLPLNVFFCPEGNTFETTPESEKVDFICPFHCGEWGSESIRNLEWEFVQCLYSAHEMSHYITENYWERKKQYRGDKSFLPVQIKFYSHPKDYSSLWYQKALLENSDEHICLFDGLSREWECGGSCYAFWKIQHINNPQNIHLGKQFIRSLYTLRE